MALREGLARIPVSLLLNTDVHMWPRQFEDFGRRRSRDVVRHHSGSQCEAGAEQNPRVLESAEAERGRAQIEQVLAGRLLMTAFQPIFNIRSGSVEGVEALTRFVTADAIAPEKWFTNAAAVGLGTPLEYLAIQTALDAARDLPEHLYVALNVSPRTCLDRGLAAILKRSSIPCARIILELTEHAPVHDYAVLTTALAGLRRRGVRIAIDDSGAGFATFRHIVRLAPEFIKLDRELVAGIDVHPAQHALGAAIVMFAREIGANVVAEGVETAAELKAITDLGMEGVQGFLLGRPSVERGEWARWQRSTPPEMSLQV
jgi:EAL domain-containing protein (putative c-di-GMP-specific phosphodiesterase class I)